MFTIVSRARSENKVQASAISHRPNTEKPSQILDNPVWRSLAQRRTNIHTNLEISHPADPSEQEADRIAERVMQTGESEMTSGADRANPQQHSDAIVNESAHSQGQPLDSASRSFMEPRFGQDFSGVRLHTDSESANASRLVNARAFTVGPDIMFGSGEYAPGTSRGRHLLAHELSHVVQQRNGEPAQVQRAVAFGSMYQGKGGKVRSHLGVEYNAYKDNLGSTKASSETGGHAFPEFLPITREELLEVFTQIAKDIDDKQDPKDKQALETTVDFYLEKLNQAFRTFKIDTVEAQASYIANAWRESAQFRFMTETEGAVKGNLPYQSNPQNVKLNTTWLNKAANKEIPNVINYEPGGSINPMTDWQKSFIGRGPIQVTHRHFYIQAIAVMEKRAEELEKADPKSQDAKDLREAIDKIKTDPREAANPKYAFMFSAAFMKMPDDEGVRGDVKATQGKVTNWMGKQPADAKKDKEKAYKVAFDMLMEKLAWYERAHSLTAAEAAERAEQGDFNTDVD